MISKEVPHLFERPKMHPDHIRSLRVSVPSPFAILPADSADRKNRELSRT